MSEKRIRELVTNLRDWSEMLMLDFDKRRVPKVRYIDMVDWSRELGRLLKVR